MVPAVLPLSPSDSLDWESFPAVTAGNIRPYIHVNIHTQKYIISICIKQSVCPRLSTPPPGYILGPNEMNFANSYNSEKENSFCP